MFYYCCIVSENDLLRYEDGMSTVLILYHCNSEFLQTLGERFFENIIGNRKKILANSIFSYSYNAFCPSKGQFPCLNNSELGVCKWYKF